MYLVMVKRIRTIYPHGLNKGFSLKFCVGSRVWQETPDEGQRMHRLKRFEYNNKDEENSLNDKNYQVSSQKFRLIVLFCYLIQYDIVT